MHRALLLVPLPLLLLGFATAHRPGDRADLRPTSCIDPHQIVARYPMPPRSLIFEMAGGIRYRNDLIGACPGVARATGASIVQLELHGTRLCANDSIRVYDPVEARGVGARAFARCRLGNFTPITRP
jgi:hypothetical protein